MTQLIHLEKKNKPNKTEITAMIDYIDPKVQCTTVLIEMEIDLTTVKIFL